MLFKLAWVTDTSMNHNKHMKRHMKRFDHCLWLCRMARSTVFFSWEKSGEFEGKIWLAPCHHYEHKHAVISAGTKRCLDTCSRSYLALAPGASSHVVCAACPAGTYAGSAGPWHRMLARKCICGSHVSNGLLQYEENMYADEAREGSGGH